MGFLKRRRPLMGTLEGNAGFGKAREVEQLGLLCTRLGVLKTNSVSFPQGCLSRMLAGF